MDSRSSNYILAKYDVSGIQEYIFAGNRLRENAGASYQVTRVLEKFLVDAIWEAASLKAAKVLIDWKKEEKLQMPENEDIMAEIIYIGGGNAVALFRDRELFQSVGEKFGMKAAINCYGLCLSSAYIQTDLHDFAEDRQKLDCEMEKTKRNMVRQLLYSPFPVAEQDNLSRQPITRSIPYGETTENMTEIQFQKREAYRQIGKYPRLYPDLRDGSEYGYPEEMDQLCREHGADSQVAIVHIDGNGMGERIIKLMKEHETYLEGVPLIRKESREISELFWDTYREVLQKLWDHGIFTGDDGLDSKKQKEKVFPLRPIILDGDDFTFLCRADLAVPIAAAFMKELIKKQQGEAKKITACAGIAFVHSHFPFYAAYSIAEESCSLAKEKWYAKKEELGRTPESGYLDFQMIKGSEAVSSGQNKKWRKCPYAVYLDEKEGSRDSLKLLYGTLKSMEEWPSGRLHKIYRAILEGEDAVKLLQREFTSRGYGIDKLAREGWRESPLFDALELQGMCRVDLLKDFMNFDMRVDR